MPPVKLPRRFPKFKVVKVLVIISLLLGICFGVSLIYFKLLVVRQVKCQGGYSAICAELEEILAGQQLFNLDLEKLSKRLAQVNPEIKTAGVQRRWDGTLAIEFVPREPLGVFVVNGDNYVFDAAGVVYKEVSGPGSLTPVILSGQSDIYVNTNALSQAALSAVGVLKACREGDFNVSQIKDLGGFLSLQTPEGLLVWLPFKNDLPQQSDYFNIINRLQEIIKQASLEQRNISKVDFRYSKVVVE